MRTKEEKAAYAKAYNKANKERIKAESKVYYAANREKKAAYAKAYREANREKKAAYAKAYREANREETNAYAKAYQKANREELKAKRDERNLMIFNYKGAECNHCGLSEPKHLEIYDYHHVDPDTKLYSVSNILKGPIERLRTEVDKCLLLCSNCHRKEHARLNRERL